MTKTVVKVEKAGKYRVRVNFDYEETLILSLKTLKKLDLCEGAEVSGEAYENILNDEVYPLARKKAMELLVKCDRTEKELRDRLKYAGFMEDAIDQAIDYVNHYHYINDEQYADNFIRYKSGSMSNMRLRQELSKRGIEEEAIERRLEGRDEMEILKKEMLRRLNRVSLSDENDIHKNLEKIKASFYRRGFSLSDINRIISEYMDNNNIFY